MPEYQLLLHGLETSEEGLPGSLVCDLLGAVDHGARGALRLRVEGRSRARSGPEPGWVGEAAAFRMVDLLPESRGVCLHAKSLGDALPEWFGPNARFLPADPSGSVLSLLGESLTEAFGGNEDSDAYDEPLLHTFEEFRRVFRHGVRAVELRNESDAGRVELTPERLEVVRRLQRGTPMPRRVRVAGTVDAIRHSDRAFTLVLRSGQELRGVLAEGEPDELARFFGRVAVVSGLARFRPSGAPLRVDADFLEPGTEDDLATWSALPRPLDMRPELREARVAQTARNGINAVIGRWPGDESEEEIFRLLDEMS